MAKFFFFLPTLLLLASCTQLPQPEPSVGAPRPVARATVVDREVQRTTTVDESVQSDQPKTPLVPAPEVVETEPTEPEKVQPDLTKPISKKQPGIEPEPVEPELDETPEPIIKDQDIGTEEPSVDTGKAPEPVKPEEVTTPDAEKEEQSLDKSISEESGPPVEGTVEEATKQSVPTVARKDLQEDLTKKAPKEKEAYSIELTIISTTKSPVYYFAGEQLISSVRPAAYEGQGARYIGSKELDLWRSPKSGQVDASSVLESVGTVTLPEDASSCIVFCASNGGAYRFVVLPDGPGHLSDNSLCFVNLTATTLTVSFSDKNFRVSSRDHHDMSISDTIINSFPARFRIEEKGQASGPEFSGVIHGKGGNKRIFLLAKNIVVRNGSLQVHAIGQFDRNGPFITPDPPIDPVAPKLEESGPSKTLDAYERIQPAIKPGKRTI